jgi:hypothetical protein
MQAKLFASSVGNQIIVYWPRPLQTRIDKTSIIHSYTDSDTLLPKSSMNFRFFPRRTGWQARHNFAAPLVAKVIWFIANQSWWKSLPNQSGNCGKRLGTNFQDSAETIASP